VAVAASQDVVYRHDAQLGARVLGACIGVRFGRPTGDRSGAPAAAAAAGRRGGCVRDGSTGGVLAVLRWGGGGSDGLPHNYDDLRGDVRRRGVHRRPARG
jgi:hypothetical protein